MGNAEYMGIQSKRKYSTDDTTHSKRATASTMRQLSLLLLLSAATLCSASTLRVKRDEDWNYYSQLGSCYIHSQCGPPQACSQVRAPVTPGKCVHLCISDNCNKGVNNARDLSGRTPLLRAANENLPLYVAKRLIENSANVDSANKKGFTALHSAAYRNSVAMAKVLIENSANVDSADNDGWTALHYAASRNSVAVAKVLIENSANVDSTDKNGWTALHYAASRNNQEMVELLRNASQEQ